MKVIVIGAGGILTVSDGSLDVSITPKAVAAGGTEMISKDGMDYAKIVEAAQQQVKAVPLGPSEPPYIIKNYRQEDISYERIAKPMKTHIDNRKVFRHTKRKKR